MTTTETILSAVGGAAGLGAVARALWTWWTERDKAARDAAAERARATHAADTDATAALVAELKAQSAASERRAEAAAEGRAQVAGWVYDGTNVTIWADGVPVVQGTYAPASGLDTVATTLAIGSNVSGTELCSMRLVCLAFYDTALTDSQWAQIMKHARIAYGVL